MRAMDVMVHDVITIHPEDSIADAAKLITENDVSALPVVDNDGRLVGVISEADLMNREEIGTTIHHPWWIEAVTPAATLATEFVKSHVRRAQSGRQLLAGAVRGDRDARPGQDGGVEDEPGRQARPWRRAAGSQGVGGATRGVPVGCDCISPSCHSVFSTPVEMMEFIAEMRRLSGGKPAGFKLCVGHPWEFLALCKAMLQTGIYPDFIVIDGKEGGTGAAPLEFLDHIGMPMREGLNFVHNALIGIDARDRIKLGASGKIVSAFDIARAMALGADWCNAARGFMFALGCIQSQSCHTDRCPVGVATQDRTRQRALVVNDKWVRVKNFHAATQHALSEIVSAAGLDHPKEFMPAHFSRRVSAREALTYAELYPPLKPGALLAGDCDDPRFREAWKMASSASFRVAA